MNIFLWLTGTRVAEAGTLFTMPDASTTLTQIGAYSSPIFTDFLPIIYLILGVLVVVFIVTFIIHAMHPNKK